MKRKNLDNMFNLIDEDILEEANPVRSKKQGVSKFGWAQIIIGAACLILTLNLAIMIPVFLSGGNDPGGEPGSTNVIDNDKTDTESEKQTDSTTNTEPSTDTGVSSGTETDLPTETDTSIESEPPRDTESDVEPEDTETNTETETETDTDTDTSGGVVVPGIKQIYVDLPGGGTHVITLSSPLVGATSEYDKIVASMQSFIGGTKNDELGGDLKDEMEDAMDKAEQDQVLKEEYKETTDNQVSGIIEGDIIKRSSKYIYYFSGSTLKIYPMNGLETALLNSFSISEYLKAIRESLAHKEIVTEPSDSLVDKWEEIVDGYTNKEMFLSLDLKTVTIISEINSHVTVQNGKWTYRRTVPYTTVLSISVEDPENVYLKDVTILSGRYESARLIDGELYVFTRYTPEIKELSVPQYDDGEGFKHIDAGKIYTPSEYRNGTYLLAFKLNGDNGNVLESSAFASFDGEIYVTESNIYVTREYRGDEVTNVERYPLYEKDENGVLQIVGYGTKTEIYSVVKTDVLRIDFSSGKFVPVGVTTVNGYIKDRYSLSENEGYLYVVTTDERVFSKTVYDEGEIGKEDDWLGYTNTTSANIFVLSASTMEIIAKKERFAPSGDKVYSVRFDGYKAYVCTALKKVIVIDPVYFFDLTDPNNITCSDTGKLPGMSTQLFELPNGDLLGIGEDSNNDIKIEVYRLGENDTVVIVDTYIIKGSYSEEYKSHFINREEGLVGLGVKNYASETMKDKYVLVQYKDGKISLVFEKELKGSNELKRAVYDKENGYFYMLSPSGIVVEKLN